MTAASSCGPSTDGPAYDDHRQRRATELNGDDSESTSLSAQSASVPG